MKMLRTSRLFSVLLILFLAFALEAKDPFGFKIIKLNNGMTAYLAKNDRKPRIQTYIAVRAGSVQDPLYATGLAHYLEHMLFKGGPKIGSLDWAKEKPLLDKIEKLYDSYGKETDPEKRKAIYAQIDQLSATASTYANDEYWTLVRNMGASGTNAFTSNDITAYVSEIPANMLERFLTLEFERFNAIALRRFHTELEAVYEEFNRGQNNDFRYAYESTMKALYPTHPLGRSVIGLPEHLKNPSMSAINFFFDRYYCGSNMAVILSGDIDFENAEALLNKTLGKLPRRKMQVMSAPPPAYDPMLTENKIINITGPQQENVIVAYRLPRNRDTEYLVDMMDSVLQNGKCGLLDVNISQKQKMQSIQCGMLSNEKEFVLMFIGAPLPGQKPEEVQKLILHEVQNLKDGKFDPALLTAAVNNARLDLMTAAEDHQRTARIALNLFDLNRTMDDLLADLDKGEKATVAQVADFAKAHLKYSVTVFKRPGKAENRVQAVKPPITPVMIPAEASPFSKELQKIPAGAPSPIQQVDYSELKQIESNSYVIENKQNERFTYAIVFPFGSYHSKMWELALSYADYLGTEKRSAEEFNRELYNLALDISFNCGTHSSSVTLSGLERNKKAGLELLAEFLFSAKSDAATYQKLVARILQGRANAKKNPQNVLSAATSYAVYGGADNPALHDLTAAELKAVDPAALTAMLRDFAWFEKKDFVSYGRKDAKPALEFISTEYGKKMQAVSGPVKTGKESLPVKNFQIKPAQNDTVYFVKDENSSQVLIHLVRPDEIAIPGKTALARIISRYAGQLAFSELREKQSLGYVAQAYYAVPGIVPDNYSMFAVILGTQPDKLETALKSVKTFADHLPEDRGLFAASKANILSQLQSARLLPEGLYGHKKYQERMKRPLDQTQQDFNIIRDMDAEQFFRELKEHSTRGKNIWIIVGNTTAEKLKAYGNVIELKKDDLFVK